MAFIGGISAGRCSLLVAKENQKGRQCPQGMKAPAGLLSRRTVCEANAACSAQQGHGDFDALDPTGCGPLRLLRALGGTRILQAAAPTAPPCIRHWRRSSPLQTRGCTPLSTPKKKPKRKNASRFAQRIFFRFSDLESLRDGRYGQVHSLSAARQPQADSSRYRCPKRSPAGSCRAATERPSNGGTQKSVKRFSSTLRKEGCKTKKSRKPKLPGIFWR